jgi:mRNA interferase MazF
VFEFGAVCLARFPFTDLPGDKRRPVLIVSRDNDRRTDVVVCFITSIPRDGPDMAMISPTPGTGQKRQSVVRFDKLATLHKSVITGRLGEASASWLAECAPTFLGYSDSASEPARPVMTDWSAAPLTVGSTGSAVEIPGTWTAGYAAWVSGGAA